MKKRTLNYRLVLWIIFGFFILLALPWTFKQFFREKFVHAYHLIQYKQCHPTISLNDSCPSSVIEDRIGMPAKVIYRNSSSWHSSFWIAVGNKDNEKLAFPIISKNSPVMYGNALIGIIDYVGTRQSRVKLITDSSIVPSVRAVRGNIQAHWLRNNLKEIEARLPLKAQNASFLNELHMFIEQFEAENINHFLAKGELHGSGKPVWRREGLVLKGYGFNYEYDDEYGPARDLRTGEARYYKEEAMPIIQQGDILVTTGLDGLFPEGISVASVSKVYPLKEGDYVYQIEALPLACNLDHLSWVYVLPSVGFDMEDIP